MKKLQVYIEIEGMQTYVGSISGSSPNDAQFAYSDQYIAAGHPPIREQILKYGGYSHL